MTAAIASATGLSDSTLRVLWRALVVARVPLASIIVAFVIFSQTEALDLFVDIPPNPVQRFFHWLMFYAAVILFWMLPVHFSARVALQLNHERIGIDTPRRYLAFVIGLPRVLSGLCLVAIFYGVLQAWNHVPSVAKESLADDARGHLLWVSACAAVLCVLFMLVFAWLSRLVVLERSRLRPIAPLLYDSLDSIVARCRPRLRRVYAPVFDDNLAAAQHNTLLSLFLFLSIVFLIDALLAIVFLAPKIGTWVPTLESYLPRAVFVPVLLGINIPGLALLGILSHRFRMPLIIFFFVLLAIWGLFREDRHKVRLLEENVSATRISLQQAVEAWKTANGCAGKPGNECPQPIIVAGSGGASRAAFMTANALALLQQRYPDFSKRLFALSTVSGSSLGAAAFVAGLGGNESDVVANACKDRRYQGWFACHKGGMESRTELDNSRLQKRMQLFLSNDFLTPVFVTLAFSDMWRLGTNRAVRLETAWETAWQELSRDAVGKGDFVRPLSQFLPATDWRPLLIFNGTSVGTGRRIIVSSLLPAHEGRRLFTDAFDFYEMTCPGEGGGPPHCDLRLSTAVSMSARFPLVSPSGVIARKDAPPVDRVVDGGYFENFGAQTALELARELKGPRHNLHPFILQITNDPSTFNFEECRQKNIDWAQQYQHQRPQPPFAFDEADVFRWAVDPLHTVLTTRTARGNHATAEALATVEAGNYAQIRVCPQRMDAGGHGLFGGAKQYVYALLEERGYVRKQPKRADAFKSLSASWWLSAPVQQYLHQQLTLPHNSGEIDRVRKALGAP